MKNSKNLVIRFVFILAVVSINALFAQQYEYYPFEDTKTIITASADNYFPKLNEPVKLKLEIMLPHDISSKNNIGFSVRMGNKDGMEILEGEQWNKKEYKKNQIIEMMITVKFTKKMYYQVKARFASRAFVLLPFYVDGAYIPSLQVQNIRKKIIELREQIIEHNKGNKITNRCVLNDYPVRDGTKNIFSTTTEYEKTTLAIKKADKYNIQLFATLKKEYDSLSVIVEKLFNEDLKKERQKMRKERNKLNKTNKQNSDSINLQGVFEESSQNSSSPNENLGFDPMYAIKNHRSAGSYAIYNVSTGEYLSIININVVPNTLGHTEFLTEYKNIFIFLPTVI